MFRLGLHRTMIRHLVRYFCRQCASAMENLISCDSRARDLQEHILPSVHTNWIPWTTMIQTRCLPSIPRFWMAVRVVRIVKMKLPRHVPAERCSAQTPVIAAKPPVRSVTSNSVFEGLEEISTCADPVVKAGSISQHALSRSFPFPLPVLILHAVRIDFLVPRLLPREIDSLIPGRVEE